MPAYFWFFSSFSSCFFARHTTPNLVHHAARASTNERQTHVGTCGSAPWRAPAPRFCASRRPFCFIFFSSWSFFHPRLPPGSRRASPVAATDRACFRVRGRACAQGGTPCAQTLGILLFFIFLTSPSANSCHISPKSTRIRECKQRVFELLFLVSLCLVVRGTTIWSSHFFLLISALRRLQLTTEYTANARMQTKRS